MKKIALAMALTIVVICLVVTLGQGTAKAGPKDAQTDMVNKVIMCGENGQVLEILGRIRNNFETNWAAGNPVPQIGSTIVTKAGATYKVTDVQYVYGSEDIYCVKVFVGQ